MTRICDLCNVQLVQIMLTAKICTCFNMLLSLRTNAWISIYLESRVPDVCRFSYLFETLIKRYADWMVGDVCDCAYGIPV